MYELPPPDFQWSDNNWRRGTHTCGLDAGHELPHLCPLCRGTWYKPGGGVTPFGTTLEPAAK